MNYALPSQEPSKSQTFSFSDAKSKKKISFWNFRGNFCVCFDLKMLNDYKQLNFENSEYIKLKGSEKPFSSLPKDIPWNICTYFICRHGTFHIMLRRAQVWIEGFFFLLIWLSSHSRKLAPYVMKRNSQDDHKLSFPSVRISVKFLRGLTLFLINLFKCWIRGKCNKKLFQLTLVLFSTATIHKTISF